MTTKKPKRVHIQIRNPHTGASRCLTLYGVDEKQAEQQIRRLLEEVELAGVGAVPAGEAETH